MRRRWFLILLGLGGCTSVRDIAVQKDPLPPEPLPVPEPPLPLEDGMANNNLIASDSFQRADGPIGSNWIQDGRAIGVENISSNQVVPPATGSTYGQLWNATAFPADQISEITLGTGIVSAVGNFISLVVRGQSGADTSYNANINNGNLIVNRTVNGTSTQLSSTVAIGIASGDVFSLQAVGAVISVYQNGSRKFYYYDTTITAAGAPGFRVLAGNTAQVSIASWRGYGCVQQDGIWQKRGIVIPGISGSFLIGPVTPSQVIFEGNAQILSGTVYKIWFSDGPQSASAQIWNAESPDGVTWTRGAAPVLTGFLTPAVIKVGNTYYMYVQAGTAAGTGTFALYTSSNGTSWTQQSTTILGLGSAGAWDSTRIWSFVPVDIVGGTWRALYSAGKSGDPYFFSMGLATSPDGLTWTKYSGNPVLANAYVTQAIANIGGSYYIWVAGTQLGRNGPLPTLDPCEGVRYRSNDLINWTNATHSIHCSQLYEHVNGTPSNGGLGQSYFSAMINVNGQAYGYINAAASDAAVPQIFQLGLAVAPAAIASVVTAGEDGMAVVGTDGFSTPGNLSSQWITPVGGTKLTIPSAGIVEPSVVGSNCQQYFSGGIFSADQYSEVTLLTLANSSCFMTPMVRCQTGAVSFYGCNMKGALGTLSAGFLQLVKVVNGSTTGFGPQTSFTPQVGDVLRIAIVGNVLSLYQNGFLLLQYTDYANTFTTGFPGMNMFAAAAITNAQFSLWSGGNANTTPSYGGGGSGSQNDMLQLNRWCTRLWG